MEVFKLPGDPLKLSNNSLKYISIIVCHGNRLKCILKKFLKKYHKYIFFKNGAIIRLEINKKNIFLDLVDEGIIKKTDIKKYLELNPKIEFYTKDTVFKKNLNLNKEYLSNTDNTYIFYLIRHSKIEKIYDNSNYMIDDILTNYGCRQSFIIGKKLIKILQKRNETNINYLFSSELRRSRLTLGCILNELLNNDLIKIKNKNINIIPCLHELYNKYNNYCIERDNNPYNYQIIKFNPDKKSISEEVIIYDFNNIYVKLNKNTLLIIETILDKNKIKNKIKTFWSYYINYFNGIRERIVDQKKCTNINIIKTIIKEINKETFK
jgi:broad specificity phosphatase PhoE